MAKGRKPTPTALKKLRGTDQPCRVNKNEVKVDVLEKLPSAPRWFTKTQKKIYKTKGEQLRVMGVLTPLDIELFVSFCREYGNYIDTASELDNYSTAEMLSRLDFYKIEVKNKDDVIEALMKGEDMILRRLMKKNKESWERSKAIASEFGFTPSSRVKMVLPEKQDDTDNDFD